MNFAPGADREIIGECAELLEGLRADVHRLLERSPGSDTRARMHRLAHNAKGLVGFLGVEEMRNLAVGLEETLKRFLEDEHVSPTLKTIESIGARVDKLGDLVRGFESAAKAPGGRADEGDALRPAFEALVVSVGEVLSGFDVPGAECVEPAGAGDEQDGFEGPGGLAVVADLGAEVGASVVAHFGPDVTRPVAGKVAAFIFGEEVSVSEGEEDELARGALGELVNYIAIATLTKLDLPPETGAPRFVTGGRLLARPGVARWTSVRSGLGDFCIALVPGDPRFEGDDLAAAPPGSAPAPRGTVVVTDDSMVMRKTLERMLVKAGFEVVAEARNGQEAVEHFRRHRPDLVTMDINMPVMGGLDALRIIRAEDPSARVLLCSAIAESGIVRRGLSSGAVGYITKPFKPETLLEAVKYLMKEGAATSAPGNRGAARPEMDSLGVYRVEKLLGEGGMALVYRGHDPGLGRGVALKVIRDKYSGDVDLVVRFLEEARAVARVSHANVVSIYAAGSDRGKHFFAMELLPGPDLEELVYRDGPLSPVEALAYVSQGADGLAAAAEKGLIHCDVKPSNLVFGADGMVKVTDFGIAQKAGTEEDPTISEMVGTPCFMSPEQVLEHPIDHRADIYSLGATLYYLLTGDPPYDGDDGVETALRHVHDPVPQVPKAPRKLNRLLAKMMAKSPDARHATYEELASDIDRLL
ncbi:MAG: protein kinase domain-containing protein [Planctomycetota bacterium]